MNIEAYDNDYTPDAWKNYTMAELGQWVHLLYVKAGHRTNGTKRQKDIQDAKNYLEMMRRKLEEVK